MANRSSTGGFTEEHPAAMRIGKTGPSNTRRADTLQYRRLSSYPLGVGLDR